MQSIAKSTLAIFTMAALMVLGYQFAIEPTSASAQSDTDQFYVNLTVDSGISISDCADASMSPNLGLTELKSVASTTCNIKTTDLDGYTLTLNETATDADPAMENQGAGTDIIDYTEAVSGTADVWSVDASTVQFGVSAVGDDVDDEYDAGSVTSCEGTGDLGTAQKWVGFQNDTAINFSTRSSATTQAGVDTTFCFAAEQNGAFADSGTYQADLTATATVQ